MSEHSANALQTILPNAAAIFTETPVPCNCGYIFHRDGTGIFRLASPYRILGRTFRGCCCNRRMLQAIYYVTFHGNIAISTGGTVEPITIALAIDGVVDPSSIMEISPTVVEEFDNVGAEISVGVPAICGCESVSVVNTSTQSIDLKNANLIIRPGSITTV